MKKVLSIMLVAVLAVSAVFAGQFAVKAEVAPTWMLQNPEPFTFKGLDLAVDGYYYFNDSFRAGAKVELLIDMPLGSGLHSPFNFNGLFAFATAGYKYGFDNGFAVAADAGVGVGFTLYPAEASSDIPAAFALTADVAGVYDFNANLSANVGLNYTLAITKSVNYTDSTFTSFLKPFAAVEYKF